MKNTFEKFKAFNSEIIFDSFLPALLARMDYEAEIQQREHKEKMKIFERSVEQYFNDVCGVNITTLDSAEYWKV